MSQPLHVLLREKITETNFILAKYQNHDSKDQWNCITSCMDWIDVGAVNISQALDELNRSNGLETCMKFYQYICCIDMVWEGICQLHRIFINSKTIPFKNDSDIFQKKYFPKNDNGYFKELRACFGAHSVNLDPENDEENIRRFASWSGHFGAPQIMSVLIYDNIPKSQSKEVVVSVDELQQFYKKRYQYISILLEKIDKIIVAYMTEMKKRIIAKSSDYKKQIEILKTESQKRFGGTVFIEELDQIDHFLATKFCSAKNADEIKAFRENMILGINEIYNSLQSMSIDYELKIEELLSPKYMPIGNDFGHEFANLHSAIFVKNPKPYFAKELTEPLKKYIEFEYETADELYWLIIIALNAAQSDLQKENKHVQTELDKALSEFEDPMATASNNSP